MCLVDWYSRRGSAFNRLRHTRDCTATGTPPCAHCSNGIVRQCFSLTTALAVRLGPARGVSWVDVQLRGDVCPAAVRRQRGPLAVSPTESSPHHQRRVFPWILVRVNHMVETDARSTVPGGGRKKDPDSWRTCIRQDLIASFASHCMSCLVYAGTGCHSSCAALRFGRCWRVLS